MYDHKVIIATSLDMIRPFLFFFLIKIYYGCLFLNIDRIHDCVFLFILFRLLHSYFSTRYKLSKISSSNDRNYQWHLTVFWHHACFFHDVWYIELNLFRSRVTFLVWLNLLPICCASNILLCSQMYITTTTTTTL